MQTEWRKLKIDGKICSDSVCQTVKLSNHVRELFRSPRAFVKPFRENQCFSVPVKIKFFFVKVLRLCTVFTLTSTKKLIFELRLDFDAKKNFANGG